MFYTLYSQSLIGGHERTYGHVPSRSRSICYREKCLSSIAEKVKHFCDQVDKLQQQNREDGSMVYKPNVHRLVEFIYHTLPTFDLVGLYQTFLFKLFIKTQTFHEG